MKEPSFIAQLYLFAAALILAGWVVWLARKKGFFTLPAARKRNEIPITFKQVLGAVGSYFLLMVILLPLLFVGLGIWWTGSFAAFEKLPFVIKGWLQQILLLFLFLWLIGYTFLLPSSSRSLIYTGQQKRTWRQYRKSAKMGFLTVGISYPLMIIANLASCVLTYLLFKKSGVEQLAVQQLKMTMAYPSLFIMMVLSVVLFVPFVEELLFRGFLQSWLLRHLTRKWAIFITAILFACAHFSPSQGWGNVELILTLLVLSCFLGFIYERERNLVAPVAMHGLFNGISTLFVFLTESSSF